MCCGLGIESWRIPLSVPDLDGISSLVFITVEIGIFPYKALRYHNGNSKYYEFGNGNLLY